MKGLRKPAHKKPVPKPKPVPKTRNLFKVVNVKSGRYSYFTVQIPAAKEGLKPWSDRLKQCLTWSNKTKNNFCATAIEEEIEAHEFFMAQEEAMENQEFLFKTDEEQKDIVAEILCKIREVDPKG